MDQVSALTESSPTGTYFINFFFSPTITTKVWKRGKFRNINFFLFIQTVRRRAEYEGYNTWRGILVLASISISIDVLRCGCFIINDGVAWRFMDNGTFFG